ncbi:hypothetical protein [Phenylobacterium sp.]|uniref:hypothetical protein n=1 Tax=Phenylobacterium sp. TaxID=1871053 RepID=UPI003919FBDE
MRDFHDIVEQCRRVSTVLVVKKATMSPDPFVEILVESGVNVLGPVDTAAKALTIIAQSPADLAVVEPELAGRRHGPELARALQEVWGVPAVVVGA